ncbi:bifunctional 5,10-methylenetetrahydrofolate dehydrogenase/5,10-methenyltetrahydrofolate cyclohydrolase [Marinomonas colpomeniae]|uniref:Bifunctional protein FolD n=1 Tax=Marinomonas colpomeniae TaxID=2774408 RepID=A0ABR8P0X3_9GAMM|nr:bifunctional methylenetetrahydrofolate dehydrogenase/methenyltetrahydrofolate cyclohydrolase FolD [Marinomonas colpomeniae]MBD5771942.1 bifunctional methylenetetrahydrofolate dehydrogenase/methenyltetrahydrofolate cyclohydrolase FolD [Marinomonas colpomeniae]
MTTVPLSSNKLSLSNNATVIIDGKRVAEEIIESVKSRRAIENIVPGLAVILVGNDAASSVYVRSKSARAKECGFVSKQFDLHADVSESEVLELINNLNNDSTIHGILVQLPLPKQINAHHVIQSIAPEKDVDGFHYLNTGKLTTGDTSDVLVPCTPAGSIHLIKAVMGSTLSGKHAVVIGRSNIVGKPMASLLLQENCTVTIIHSRTETPAELCKLADIVVAAVGIPKHIKEGWIKPGAVVIDVGINRITTEEGKNTLVGDVDFDNVIDKVSAITPVPGGVGPMTISMLMQNTLEAAIRSKRIA